ncbi:TrbG/VirB9 family P-type conjugative transfer protein [Acidithiobacillus caldus]
MRQRTLLLVLGLILSPVVFAGVAELPPVTPLPGTDAMAGAPKVPSQTVPSATAPATSGVPNRETEKSQYTVPSIQGGPGGAPSSTGVAASQPRTPAQVWRQAISTPPEGRESASTRRLAKQELAASRAADSALPVIGGADGRVTSLAGRPVLVCSPLHTCVIELPRGVQPVVTAGVSKAEWLVQQTMVGDQGEIFLSPKFAGLHQDVVIAGTVSDGTGADPKAPVNFEVRLVSDANRYVPFLKIAGSGGVVHSWNRQSAGWGSPAPVPSASTHQPAQSPVLPLPNVNLRHVHTNWTIHCGGGGWFASSDCKPIEPLRVYDDGTHTFIEMPVGLASHGGFPILQAKNASGHLIGVNTQIRGDTYVVDSVPPEITLRLGSEVVTIRHKGVHQ